MDQRTVQALVPLLRLSARPLSEIRGEMRRQREYKARLLAEERAQNAQQSNSSGDVCPEAMDRDRQAEYERTQMEQQIQMEMEWDDDYLLQVRGETVRMEMERMLDSDPSLVEVFGRFWTTITKMIQGRR